MLSNALVKFVRTNAALSDRLTPSIEEETHAYTKYRESVTALLQREPQHVLDIGAGKRWHFDPALKAPGMVLIGFDIHLSEMEGNTLLDEKVVGDACNSLGVPDQSVDLIMGRAVIEHLHDTGAFLMNASRALRADGRFVVTFASKYAPFAILNRVLPQRVSHWILAHLVPGSAGILGFEAFYDRATFTEFRQCLIDAGFEIELEYASFFSSWYYRFFVPLFLAGLCVDYLRYAIGSPRLASHFTFVARKKG
jgi:SAM-dependent methyltransferase